MLIFLGIITIWKNKFKIQYKHPHHDWIYILMQMSIMIMSTNMSTNHIPD